MKFIFVFFIFTTYSHVSFLVYINNMFARHESKNKNQKEQRKHETLAHTTQKIFSKKNKMWNDHIE